MTITDIIIQEVEGGYTLQIPMLPDTIQVEAAARFLSYDIMNVGEHKIPLGEELTAFRWEGLLPGESRKDAPYVRSWTDPAAIQGKFSLWRNKGTKLMLRVPGYTINHAVYLEQYQCSPVGGCGDVEYSVRFIQAKDIIIGTVGEASANQASTGGGVKTAVPASKPPAAKTYTVRSGDSLWKIAQQLLGSGSRWRELYTLNQGTIGSNPDLIRPGQVFNLPS